MKGPSGLTNEELAARARAGDEHARNLLVRQNWAYLYKQAIKLAPYAKSLDKHDLVIEGSIGMLHALRKWDPSRGVMFITYATWWIRAQMGRAIADQDNLIRVPVRVHDHIKSGALLRDVEALTKAGLTDEEMREELRRTYGWGAKTLNGALSALRRPLSLDGPLPHHNDGEPMIAFRPSADPHADDQVDRARRVENMRAIINRLRMRLSPKMRVVLDRRILRDATLQSVGKQLHLSRERVRQMETEILGDLAHAVHADHLARRHDMHVRARSRKESGAQIVCIRCRQPGHDASRCPANAAIGAPMTAKDKLAVISIARLLEFRRELLGKLDELEALLPTSTKRRALEVVLGELTQLARFTCPLHESARESDFARDGSGCLFCLEETGVRTRRAT